MLSQSLTPLGRFKFGVMGKRGLFRLSILAMIVIIGLSGCSSQSGTITFTELSSDEFDTVTTKNIEKIKKIWDRNRPEKYEFKYSLCCSMVGGPVYHLKVVSDKVKNVNPDQAIDENILLTIDDLIDRSLANTKREDIDCDFKLNETLGIILSESCDLNVRPEIIFDDEFTNFGYYVQSFQKQFDREEVALIKPSCIFGEWEGVAKYGGSPPRVVFRKDRSYEYWEEGRIDSSSTGTFSLENGFYPYRIKLVDNEFHKEWLSIYKCTSKNNMVFQLGGNDEYLGSFSKTHMELFRRKNES